jgi:hypothetical protein
MLMLGILPVGVAAFLTWIIVRSMQSAPASQNWSLAAIVAIGLVLMLIAHFGLRSSFFQIQRESYGGRSHGRKGKLSTP